MKPNRITIKPFIVFAMLLALTLPKAAADTVIMNGRWRITFVKAGSTFKVNYQKEDGSYRPIFIGSLPEAGYDNNEGVSRSVTPASFSQMSHSSSAVNDEFGEGTAFIFQFSNPTNGDDVTLTQQFVFYKEHDYMVTGLTLTAGDTISSNYLAPVSCSAAYSLYVSNDNNRMLKVPFDNDGFVRYHKYDINTTMTSYEVTALYEGESRNGLVIGSVEHNRWKSAIAVNAANHGKLNSIKVFSGVSNSETRDVLPHGKVRGTSIASARFFVGFFDDWREGMEMFGEANTLVQPMRNTWTGGTPFGWQSWGVMSDKNSYQTDVDVSNYFHDVLAPAGFCGEGGLNIISIDSWDNLSYQQKVDLNKVGAENGQIVGTYCSPFALWWSEDMLDGKLDGQTRFTARECVLKVNGEPYKLDGAYCLDPTHPGVKSNIATQLRVMKAQGFKYVKVDFTSNGMVQADSYYNKKVTTAVEAYNEGFSYFIKKADEGEPMFVALSIAPVFPYQYGNSRRIACDTWGKIDQTEYSLNAISGGWWTNCFYQFNDPDHLVLVGNDNVKETLGENRARITNGVVSGMLLVADNYSLSDNSGRGDAGLSRSRAQAILMNRDVNEAGRIGRSFMPVYGYQEYNGKDSGAENLFMHHTAEYLYVAIVNYKSTPLVGTLPLADLKFLSADYDTVKELWSGDDAVVLNQKLVYTIPMKDAKIYRFHKKTTAVDELRNEDRMSVVLLDDNGTLCVQGSAPIAKVEMYNLSGQQLCGVQANGKYQVNIPVPSNKGVVILRCTFADGSSACRKVLPER